MYEKIILPNGVRVVADKMQAVRTASLGVFVGVGCRHESAELSGASHFIEHMAFKGTSTRSAEQLAQFIDSAGGNVNAYTSNHLTCFHGKVVDSRLSEFAEVLGDMTLNSSIADSDVDSERHVIHEEIDMYEDSPENVASERLFGAVYSNSSLGRSILGTHESLEGLDSRTLLDFMRRSYVGDSMVISLAGNFSDTDLHGVCDVFSQFPAGSAAGFDNALYAPQFVATTKDIEQSHLVLALPSVGMHDPRRYAMVMLSDILGAGVSSRLFQEVRERRGLCYSIYSQVSSFSDTGLLTIATATNPESQEKMLETIVEVIRQLLNDGITEAELQRERELVSASILMSLESSSSRMARAGNNELSYGKLTTPDEAIAKFEAVTIQDIADIAAETLRREALSASLVGKNVSVANLLDIPAW